MLKNQCNTCGRDLGSGYMCPVCSRLTTTQNVKTPTKEQIEQIAKKYWWMSAEGVAVVIIEWEKIRGRTNADN